MRVRRCPILMASRLDASSQHSQVHRAGDLRVFTWLWVGLDHLSHNPMAIGFKDTHLSRV
jgi:hypothetical protein